MPGPSQPWDQPEDPREQTVDLPRIDIAAGNGSAHRDGKPMDPASPLWAGRASGNGHRPGPPMLAEPYGRLEPPPRAEPNGHPEPPPRAEPYTRLEPPVRAEPNGHRQPPAHRSPDLNGDPYAQHGPDGRPRSLFEPSAPAASPTEPPAAEALAEPAAHAQPAETPAEPEPPEQHRLPERGQSETGQASPDAEPPNAVAPHPPATIAAAQVAPPRRRVPPGRGRPAAGSLLALRARLDQLPDGHPSSPYSDDGLAKVPPRRLNQFELGLPAPEREATRPPRSRLPADRDIRPAAPVSRPAPAPPAPAPAPPAPAPPPQAEGPPDTDHQDLVARTLTAGRAAEGQNMFGGYGSSGLTPAVRRIAVQLGRGGLAPGSETTTLKSPERLAAKLTRLIARHPDRTADEIAAGICDVVRYAFCFDPEDYTEGTWLVHRKFKVQGFDLEARRNRWESPEYKGIWTRWRDPAHDLVFEVQFHTTASWDAVQRTHPAYLLITDPATPPAERARLRARQVAAVAAIKPPPRCAEFEDVGWEAR